MSFRHLRSDWDSPYLSPSLYLFLINDFSSLGVYECPFPFPLFSSILQYSIQIVSSVREKRSE